MTPTQEKPQLENEEQETRFYLIFNELAKADAANISDVGLDEIDEIERVRRIVMDVADEPPIFMTST